MFKDDFLRIRIKNEYANQGEGEHKISYVLFAHYFGNRQSYYKSFGKSHQEPTAWKWKCFGSYLACTSTMWLCPGVLGCSSNPHCSFRVFISGCCVRSRSWWWVGARWLISPSWPGENRASPFHSWALCSPEDLLWRGGVVFSLSPLPLQKASKCLM